MDKAMAGGLNYWEALGTAERRLGKQVFSMFCTTASTDLQLGSMATGEYTVVAYPSKRVLRARIIKK